MSQHDCGKTPFATAHGAHVAMRKMLNRHNLERQGGHRTMPKGLHLDVYQCEFCQQFHFGNSSHRGDNRLLKKPKKKHRR